MEYAKNVLISVTCFFEHTAVFRFAFLRSDLSCHHTRINLRNLSAHPRPAHAQLPTLVSHGRGPSDTRSHEPGSPTPCVPSYWPGPPPPRWRGVVPESLFAMLWVPWCGTSPIGRRGSTACANRDRPALRSLPDGSCPRCRFAVAPVPG